MNRSLRALVALFVVLAVLGGLGYAAHSLDLAGMIVRMHAPPQH
jgi:hypothetical protein